MIAIDTNIIVRLLTQDDQAQYLKSHALLQKREVFIADTVALETEWVLRYAYHFDAASIVKGLRMLFGLPNVQLSNPPLMAQALEWHAEGMDFADALHLVGLQQLDAFYTFDKKFVKKAKGLTGCVVAVP